MSIASFQLIENTPWLIMMVLLLFMIIQEQNYWPDTKEY